MQKVENNEKASVQKLQSSKKRLKNLENHLEKLKNDLEFAVIDSNNYQFVRQRMMENRVFLDIKANKLRNKLKTVNEVLKEQELLLIKVLKNNGKTCCNFKTLFEKVKDEETWKSLISQKLQKEVDKKEEMVDIREDMQKRRVEIIESVANEDKNQRNNFLREGLLLSRTWSKFLSAKLLKEKQKSSYVEKAHSRIRALTGFSDINQVVQKILTKEQGYSSLMNMIVESRKKCESYSQKNIELENEMHEITVNYKEPDTKIQHNLQMFIRKGLKISARNAEKIKKLKFAKNFVVLWVSNMIKKLTGSEADGNIKDLFTQLRKAVQSKIRRYEKIDISLEFSPVINFKKSTEDVFNFSELVYPEDDSSVCSLHFDRVLRKKTTKK
jgi:hypothetical protein